MLPVPLLGPRPPASAQIKRLVAWLGGLLSTQLRHWPRGFVASATWSDSGPLDLERACERIGPSFPVAHTPVVQIDALQETHQARAPMLLRVAFATRNLWNGSQRSGGTHDALYSNPFAFRT